MSQNSKKYVTLTESEVLSVIKLIVEQVNMSGYQSEDFVEVGIDYFKKWVKENHNLDLLKYPLSFLVKKYIDEFSNKFLGSDTRPYAYNYNTMKMFEYIGRELVKRGVYVLATMQEEGTFKEKFGKALDWFIKKRKFPEYLKLTVNEPEPYVLQLSVETDFVEMIKSKTEMPNTWNIRKSFSDFIEEMLGLELGSPQHGQINLTTDVLFRMNGEEEWVKNVFNKSIKKKIKENDELSRSIQRIQFKINSDRRPEIKLVQKWSSPLRGYQLKLKFKKILEDEGYNPENFSIDV